MPELSAIARRALTEKGFITFEPNGLELEPGEFRDFLSASLHRMGFAVDDRESYLALGNVVEIEDEDENEDGGDGDEDDDAAAPRGGSARKGAAKGPKAITPRQMGDVGAGVCTHGLKLLNARFPAASQSLVFDRDGAHPARLYLMMNGALSRIGKVLARPFTVRGENDPRPRSLIDLVLRGGHGSDEAVMAIRDVLGDDSADAFIGAVRGEKVVPVLAGHGKGGDKPYSVPVIFLPNPLDGGETDVQVTPVSEADVYKRMQTLRKGYTDFRSEKDPRPYGRFAEQTLTVKMSNVTTMLGGKRARAMADFPATLSAEDRALRAYVMGASLPRIRDERFDSMAENAVRLWHVYATIKASPAIADSLERLAAALGAIAGDHVDDLVERGRGINPEFSPPRVDARTLIRFSARFTGGRDEVLRKRSDLVSLLQSSVFAKGLSTAARGTDRFLDRESA